VTYLGGLILIASTMVVVRAEEARKAGAPPLAADADAAAAAAAQPDADGVAGGARELQPLPAAAAARMEDQTPTSP
jgi:hypothetical protein